MRERNSNVRTRVSNTVCKSREHLRSDVCGSLLMRVPQERRMWLVADASTSVESRATTARVRTRVSSTVCESREHLRSDVCGSSNVAL